MRIVYITEIYPDVGHGLGVWGGGEKQFYEISQRIAKRGHDVSVLTCRFPGQPSRQSVGHVKVFRQGLTRDSKTGGARKTFLPIASYLLQTAKQVVDLSPDLIHCNTYFPVFAGKIAAEICRARVVSTFHDIYKLTDWIEDQKSHFWGLLGHVATIVSARVPHDRIIAVSPQCKRKLAGLGVRPEKTTVIPNGVDLSLFDSIRVDKKPSQILYVGRLVVLKHVDRLIQAVSKVLHAMPEATLKIVGDGPERVRLQTLVLRLGLESKVTFTGVTPTYDAVAGYFKESALFVLPSMVEGEAIAAKEAMAAGLPVIAMRVEGSGVLSYVEDGKNGFLVDPSVPNGLAERIVELLKDEARRRIMGEAARKSVETYDWEVIAERTLRLYR